MSDTKSAHERRTEALEQVVDADAFNISCKITDGEGRVQRDTLISDMSDTASVTLENDSHGNYAFVDFYDEERNVETTLTVDADSAARLANFFRDLSSDLSEYE